MILSDATPSQRDAVLAQTHALWAAGLDLEAYWDLIATLMSCDWARAGAANYRFLVLAEGAGGEPLAATKLYRFSVRLGGERLHAGGVGAVFTPPSARGRGHASSMLRLAHEVMRGRGDALALLFSEIGPGFYARLGYRELPLRAVRLPVPPPGEAEGAGASGAGRPGGGGGVLRFSRAEIPLVMRLREEADRHAAFALLRDRDYWGYLLARASYPTLWLGRERWESRLTLAGDRGYLWALLEGEGAAGTARARLLEVVEAEPGAAAPALLDDLFDACRRRRIGSLECWSPSAAAAREPRFPAALGETAPSAVVPMWMALREEVRPELDRAAGAAVLHMADLF